MVKREFVHFANVNVRLKGISVNVRKCNVSVNLMLNICLCLFL